MVPNITQLNIYTEKYYSVTRMPDNKNACVYIIQIVQLYTCSWQV